MKCLKISLVNSNNVSNYSLAKVLKNRKKENRKIPVSCSRFIFQKVGGGEPGPRPAARPLGRGRAGREVAHEEAPRRREQEPQPRVRDEEDLRLQGHTGREREAKVRRGGTGVYSYINFEVLVIFRRISNLSPFFTCIQAIIVSF